MKAISFRARIEIVPGSTCTVAHVGTAWMNAVDAVAGEPEKVWDATIHEGRTFYKGCPDGGALSFTIYGYRQLGICIHDNNEELDWKANICSIMERVMAELHTPNLTLEFNDTTLSEFEQG